jgi:hypothetical protein
MGFVMSASAAGSAGRAERGATPFRDARRGGVNTVGVRDLGRSLDIEDFILFTGYPSMARRYVRISTPSTSASSDPPNEAAGLADARLSWTQDEFLRTRTAAAAAKLSAELFYVATYERAIAQSLLGSGHTSV